MNDASRGKGALFSNPSANEARRAFATKSRAHTDKLTTVAKAVELLVKDEEYLAIGGFGSIASR